MNITLFSDPNSFASPPSSHHHQGPPFYSLSLISTNMNKNLENCTTCPMQICIFKPESKLKFICTYLITNYTFRKVTSQHVFHSLQKYALCLQMYVYKHLPRNLTPRTQFFPAKKLAWLPSSGLELNSHACILLKIAQNNSAGYGLICIFIVFIQLYYSISRGPAVDSSSTYNGVRHRTDGLRIYELHVIRARRRSNLIPGTV